MSGSQQLLLGGAPTVTPVDPYFYSVTSLLHGDGTNGGQNNTFLDSSTNNFTITRNGNTTQGSFSPFSQTGWGNYFNTLGSGSGSISGDYLTVADNSAFALGSGDFTIEAWIFPVSYPSAGYSAVVVSKGGGGAGSNYSYDVAINSSGTVTGQCWISGPSSFGVCTSSAAISLNSWTHIAYVRSGSNFTLYLNGVSVATATSSSSCNAITSVLGIGTTTNIFNNFFKGYINNLRIVKGTAVYTSNFTVPTTPLTAITNTSLLTCQSNRFLDSSTNNFTITASGTPSVQPFSPFNPTTAYSTSSVGGSGYFDGSGDFLNFTASSVSTSADFTVECWIYPNASISASNYGIFALSDARFGLITVTGTLYLLTTTGDINTSTALLVYQWNHIAVTRTSNVLRVFLNGSQVGSTQSNSQSLSGNWRIASNQSGEIFPACYISGARILIGTGGTSVPVPTAPLTAITNTNFLCNFTNGAIFDNAAVADYETVGNAQISTSVKKYGTGSLAFDGTGDYLTSSANSATLCAFGTGDFTIEFWIYFNTVSGNQSLVDLRPSGVNGAYPLIYASSTSLTYYVSSASQINGGVMATGIWYHVAISRIASQTKMFLNGTQVGSTYADTNSYLCGAGAPWVGSFRDGTGQLNGYIDDLRITKGVGRYQYNFTPPTAEFPNIGGPFPTLTADPYYEYTTLLLPGNGTNGAQNNTFLDSSTNAFTITRNGNTTQGTFSPFSQTGWGNYFDGTSGQYLNTVANTAFNFGTGDFTVEAWVYPTGTLSVPMPIIEIRTTGGATGFAFLRTASAQTLNVYTNSAFVGASTISLVLNSWNHVALTRSGNTWSYWINGTSAGSFTNSSTQSDGGTTGPKIGGSTTAGEVWIGYISNARITKGGALYTSNFTPSTTPLTTTVSAGTVSLLTCQSNRFLDSSSNAFAITVNGSPSVQAFSPFNPTASWSAATYGGSGYFDTSGDFLNLTDTSNKLDLGNATASFETWIYPSSATVVLANKSGGTANYNTTDGIEYTISFNAQQFLMYYNVGGTYGTLADPTTGRPLNQWYHVVVASNSTTLSLYVNGTRVVTATAGVTKPTNRTAVRIGTDISGTYGAAYFTDTRFIQGTGAYDASQSSITVPTAPLTAVTNTQLLLSYTNAGIYDATSKNDLETVGNAQISTTQSKFGGSSMYFDGTGDTLVTFANKEYYAQRGDFTIECWVRPSNPANGTYQYFGAAEGNPYFQIGLKSDGKFVFAKGYFSDITSSTTAATADTWYHVAITRYGSTCRLFVNGVLQGSGTDSSVCTITGTNGYTVGGLVSSGTVYYPYTGYIQDFRFTNGIARYTSNFTPPTTAFLTL